MRRPPLLACLAGALLVCACAEPPHKEMGQAQGAIDAARAAGAERYAATEYSAAVDALKASNDAVSQRDYRLALNHSLTSLEHAQNAAREAADTRARIRGEVERSMAEVAALLAQANSRLAAAETVRANRRLVRDARESLAQVNEDVQKAGAAMQADDYVGARPALDGVKERIEAVLETLDRAASQSPRRRR